MSLVTSPGLPLVYDWLWSVLFALFLAFTTHHENTYYPFAYLHMGWSGFVPDLGVPQQSLPLDSIDSDNHHRFRQSKSLFAGQSHPLLRHLGHSKARPGGQFLGIRSDRDINWSIWGSFSLDPMRWELHFSQQLLWMHLGMHWSVVEPLRCINVLFEE